MSMPVEKHSIPQDTRQLISTRYKTVTKAINRSLWDSTSDTAHSFYVGSYGRGTAIDTSDIDILVEVPGDYYVNSTYTTYNPQSRLLQVVKNAILESYPRSDVKGDGQVVVINFSDGMKFEILPAIRNFNQWTKKESYKYPDTHMGGNWLSTNPKTEITAMDKKDTQSNGLLKDTCRHMRYVRDNYFKSYHLSGIVIDSFVYEAMGNWHYLTEGEQKINYDETYEEVLLRYWNQASWNGRIVFDLTAPGSKDNVNTQGSYECLGKVLNKMV